MVIGLLVAFATVTCVFVSFAFTVTIPVFGSLVIVALLLPLTTLVTFAFTRTAPSLYVTVVPLPFVKFTISPALTDCLLSPFTFSFQFAALIAFATSFAVTKPLPSGTVIFPFAVVFDNVVVLTLNFTTPLSPTSAVVCVPFLKFKPSDNLTVFPAPSFALYVNGISDAAFAPSKFTV